MPLLAIHILAQTLTFGVGDRAELRWLKDSVQSNAEVEDRAIGSVGLAFKHATLGVSYAPTVLVTNLEGPATDATFLHSVTGVAQASWNTQRTRYVLTAATTYGLRNFLTEALGSAQPVTTPPDTGAQPPPAQGGTAPPPAGAGTGSATSGTGTTTTTNLTRVTPQSTAFVSAHAAASVSHDLSRELRFSSELGYDVTGGVGKKARTDYPLAYGPQATVDLDDRFTRRDTLSSSLVGTMFFATRSYRSWILTEMERLTHLFNRSTTGIVGAGVAYTREVVPTGEAAQQVQPVGEGALVYATRFGAGHLSLSLGSSFAPQFDRVTFRFDSRVNTFGVVTWTRNRLTLSATAANSVSIHPQRTGALTSRNVNALTAYDLGSGFSVEGGARLAWQTYQGSDTIPPTLVIFTALAWAADTGR